MTAEIMDKDRIDRIVLKLSAGYKLATSNHVLKNELIFMMGKDIVNGLLVIAKEDDALMKYALQQLIVKTPEIIKDVSDIVKELYPNYKDFIDKMIILT